jgi:hypothetical protein
LNSNRTMPDVSVVRHVVGGSAPVTSVPFCVGSVPRPRLQRPRKVGGVVLLARKAATGSLREVSIATGIWRLLRVARAGQASRSTPRTRQSSLRCAALPPASPRRPPGQDRDVFSDQSIPQYTFSTSPLSFRPMCMSLVKALPRTRGALVTARWPSLRLSRSASQRRARSRSSRQSSLAPE